MDITEQYPILGIPRYVITGHPYIVLIALAIVIDPVYIINPEVYPDFAKWLTTTQEARGVGRGLLFLISSTLKVNGLMLIN